MYIKKGKIRGLQNEQRRWIYPWRHDLHNLTGTWILDPTNPDSDGDGLKDGEEVRKYRFDPNVDDRTVDLDKDGLDNIKEVLNLTTEPRKWPPSKHAITYERFISGDIYAGEYITTMARVDKIRTYYGTREYYIDLRPLNSTPVDVITRKYGVVRAGNPWHYDIEHNMVFTDDNFGFTLRPGDIIVVCGRADKFRGSKRTIQVNIEGSSGTILLVLDPLEEKYRWLPSESHVRMRKKFQPLLSDALSATPTPPSSSPAPVPAPTPAQTSAQAKKPSPGPAPPEPEKSALERFVYTLKSVIDYLTPWKEL